MAFHPYPHLIHRFFNIGWCGPPSRVTVTSTWTWVDHQASGLILTTSRTINTRFRYGYMTVSLNLLIILTHRLIMQKARRHHIPKYTAPTDCKHTVSGSISLPSRGAFHLSLTVLILYRSPNVFSLTRWSSLIQPGFHVPRPTRDTHYSI